MTRGYLPHIAPELRGLASFREFRALFAAYLLSLTGDQLSKVAVTVLVFDRTGSAVLAAMPSHRGRAFGVAAAGLMVGQGMTTVTAGWLVDVAGNPPVVVGLCGVVGVVAILTVLPALRDA